MSPSSYIRGYIERGIIEAQKYARRSKLFHGLANATLIRRVKDERTRRGGGRLVGWPIRKREVREEEILPGGIKARLTETRGKLRAL